MPSNVARHEFRQQLPFCNHENRTFLGIFGVLRQLQCDSRMIRVIPQISREDNRSASSINACDVPVKLHRWSLQYCYEATRRENQAVLLTLITDRSTQNQRQQAQ